MAKTDVDKRSRLIQTAAKLAYRQGFRKTTLADIAEESQVPLGNVYYYFKTKDEIGEAILQQRFSQFEAQREKWEESGSPKERLQAFVQMTLNNREQLARGGCPIGTLCSELQREGGELAKKASPLLGGTLAWIEKQFKALGKGKDSAGLALHLLSALQGVSLLSHVSGNSNLVMVEAGRLKAWLETL
ncbi:transcriptional regulator, TetR family [Candidatus Koribacter versatilis Ellin345]|uniref:Transcriptional regulator, TetR family n=1 Tax=Koribacter versatilis (strain Ellin345) TaxID=204669 RepID=Q1IKM5_KORVE|nr:TetR/AcrR family transcriptional regulator [Candidatus Koribacter versatilis]ABF42575.1 transcriptional regulator, TetR family [Candidatus Koribacter versatilis Ellin345]